MQPKIMVKCNICKRELPRRQCLPAKALRPSMLAHLKKTLLDWDPEGFICLDDMDKVRNEYVERMLVSGKGAVNRLEAHVLKSLKEEELLSRKLMEEGQGPLTFGQRMADSVARFGGSWGFLISFALFLAVWILVNIVITVGFHAKAFDPYPFILLNLVLSCLASVQAPIIMMSQNRLEVRDRKRAESDYQVNLKAELEIRNLHDKIDHLLEHQWQYLMEIQQIQVELIEELGARKKASGHNGG